MTKLVPSPKEYFAANPMKRCKRCGVEKHNSFHNFPKKVYVRRDWHITADVCYECRKIKTAATVARRNGTAPPSDAIRAISAAAEVKPLSIDDWEKSL